MTERVRTDLRPMATALCFVAAVCLIFGAFTRSWLVNAGRYQEIGFGLRSMFECGQSYGFEDGKEIKKEVCSNQSNDEFIKKWKSFNDPAGKMVSKAFTPLGLVTFVLSLLGALGLLGAAAYGALGKPMRLPIAPTTIALLALMVGLITGCVFVATAPGPTGMVGVGMSFWIFGVGCVMGIAGSQLIAKLNRPPDEEWTVD
jgi:hypothetical protein